MRSEHPCGFTLSSVVQKINEFMATEKAQLDILKAHFALVDANNKAAAEEEAADRRAREAQRMALDAKRLPAIRKVQRWYRRIQEARHAEKKKSKGKGKGKGKGK